MVRLWRQFKTFAGECPIGEHDTKYMEDGIIIGCTNIFVTPLGIMGLVGG